jgi:hypothetical protein
MLLPPEAAPLLALFAAEFTAQTAARFHTLFAAALLTTGRRTVAGVLRTLRQPRPRPRHRLPPRPVPGRVVRPRPRLRSRPPPDRGSPRASRFGSSANTVDGHTGHGKARHRDPVRLSHAFTAWRYGHKWVVSAVLVQYGGGTRQVAVVGEAAHWHKAGKGLVPLRWVSVRKIHLSKA